MQYNYFTFITAMLELELSAFLGHFIYEENIFKIICDENNICC